MIPKSWDRRLYWWSLGLYVVLAVAALASGITSWDEETDYLGIRTQIAHAVQILHGDSPDYRDIHANLEYYGTVGLLPAWILWFIQQSVLVGRLSLVQALFYPAAEHQLTGFYFTSHLVLASEFILLSWVVILLSRELRLRYSYLSGCLVLFTPSLIGHSFVNPKDIPFALFYTLYTLALVKRSANSDNRWIGLAVLSSGLLINQKFVALAPVICSEMVLFFVQRHSLRSIWKNLSVPFSALAFALLLQPASWGLLPWVYLHETFETFARHEWGGCMWWGGSCIGINQAEWSTWKYILKWISVKVPALIVLLIIVQQVNLFFHFCQRKVRLRDPWLFVLGQLLLIPFLAVLRQSNLYDADRHLLFIYPPMAVLATAGFGYLWTIHQSPHCRMFWRSVVCILAAVLVVDILLINPYQISYLNEFARPFHSHKTTALDFWGVSAKESIRQAQLNDQLQLNPVVFDNISLLPLFIGLRQLSGHVSRDKSHPSLLIQLRDASSFNQLSGCETVADVKRNLLPSVSLTMSRLLLCEPDQ